MSTFYRALVSTFLVLAAASPSIADGAKVPLKGKLVTGYAAADPGVGTVPVVSAAGAGYGSGSGNVFVVQSICGRADSTIVCFAGGLNIYTGMQFGCVNLDPGYVIPEGQDVSCGNNGGPGNLSASVTGTVTKKQ